MATFEPKSALPDNVTDRGKVERIKLSGAGDSTEETEWVDVATQAELDALSSVYQPLDSDLTAIAALITTSTGRSLLAAADAAAIRTIAGAEASGAAASAVSAHDADTSVHGLVSRCTRRRTPAA